MRRLLTLALISAALVTSGCNTVAGVGKDVQAAGKAVTSAAKDAGK